jgi:hypothetical protein
MIGGPLLVQRDLAESVDRDRLHRVVPAVT